LRHYERLGLLATVPRSGNGYREYPTLAVERVRMIRRALAIGFSLPELATILNMRDQGKLPCRHARDLAHSKLQDLDRQMRDLTVMRHQLREILKDWDSRLRRAGENKPAKLLEALPNHVTRPEPRTQFRHSRKRRRHEGDSGGSGGGSRDRSKTDQLARRSR
jgi:DNA-binding transcriptional MerR regulator